MRCCRRSGRGGCGFLITSAAVGPPPVTKNFMRGPKSEEILDSASASMSAFLPVFLFPLSPTSLPSDPSRSCKFVCMSLRMDLYIVCSPFQRLGGQAMAEGCRPWTCLNRPAISCRSPLLLNRRCAGYRGGEVEEKSRISEQHS